MNDADDLRNDLDEITAYWDKDGVEASLTDEVLAIIPKHAAAILNLIGEVSAEDEVDEYGVLQAVFVVRPRGDAS